MALNFTPTTLTSGFGSVDALNDNFSKIDTALEDALSRSGFGSNAMSASLDMNSNKLLNVAAGTALTDGVNLKQVRDLVPNITTGDYVTVNTLVGLQATVAFDGDVVIMLGRMAAGDGGHGTFRFDSSDLSTEVAADEVASGQGDGGIYVAPASDKTGASGAWVRVFNGARHADWYGDIQAAMDAGAGTVELSDKTYTITTTLDVPEGVQLRGQGPLSTVLQISGAIDGVRMNRNCSVESLRIIGNASQTNANACIWTGGQVDSYQSLIRDVLMGGLVTNYGDGANVQYNCVGIQGGNTFWLVVDNVTVINCDIGYTNTDSSSRNAGVFANNAILFNQFRSISNRVGAELTQTNNVTMNSCHFTSSDEIGLGIGNSRTFTLIGAQFESNNRTTNAAIKADMLISSTFGGASAAGVSLNVIGTRLKGGTNSTYGIYMDGQRGASFSGIQTADYGIRGIFIANNSDNSGSLKNYSAEEVPDIDVNTFTVEEEGRFWNRANTTPNLAVAADTWQVILTPAPGEHFNAKIEQGGFNAVRYWVGRIYGLDTGVIKTVADSSANMQVSDPQAAPDWVTSTSYTAGDFVNSGGLIYEANTTGTSGATAPVHTSGIASDGGVDWIYVSTVGQIAFRHTSGSTQFFNWRITRIM